MPDQGWTITADSLPVYDEWGYDEYWGCAEWISWFNELRKKYSEDESQRRWIKAWLDGVNWFGHSVPLDCRTYNVAFKDFTSQHAMVKAAVYDGLTGAVAEFLAAGVSVVQTGSETVARGAKSAGATITNTLDLASYLVPALLGIAAIGAVVIAFNYVKPKAA